MNPLARLALHIAELLEQINDMQVAINERDQRIAELLEQINELEEGKKDTTS